MQKIPLGYWIQLAIEGITLHCDSHFRSLSEFLSRVMGEFTQGLLWFSPWFWIVLVGLWSFYFSRRPLKAVLASAGLFLIFNLGYWQESMETLALVFFSVMISILLGLPLGILAARVPSLYQILQPGLDFMQTIPTFVYLIPTLMLFGLGMAPGVISTIIFAMPALIRMTYHGLIHIPLALKEVADSFGASSLQRLTQVEIPYALSTIREGISQAVMLSLSMVVIAALVGADGLGKPVVQALNTVNIAKGFESGLAIVIMAILLDRVVLVRKQN